MSGIIYTDVLLVYFVYYNKSRVSILLDMLTWNQRSQRMMEMMINDGDAIDSDDDMDDNICTYASTQYVHTKHQALCM